LDLIPTSYQGEQALLVRDSVGIISEPILLRGDGLRILGLIDGKRRLEEIQLGLVRLSGGVFVSLDEIKAALDQLDRAFLLDSRRYRKEKERLEKEYRALRVRTAVLAGKSYPENPEELRSHLASILEGEESPATPSPDGVRALVAPHIDLEVGRKVYARAYRSLPQKLPGRVLLLGTGHSLQDALVSLTVKDFVTPLGTVRTDRVWVDRLLRAGAGVVAESDIHHRREHSLEFQLLFLQALYGNSFSLVPVLCGSFHDFLPRVSRASEIPGMRALLDELKECAEDRACPTLVVAGVDFSHVGPKFGHRSPASFLLPEVMAFDRSLIGLLCRGDKEGFWSRIREVEDRYHVCGFSTLAVLLEMLSDQKGRLLGYDVWMEEATRSAVSFAALAFSRR